LNDKLKAENTMLHIVHRLVLLSMFSMPAFAQWHGFPTPNIPRTADGKPDMSAPAPRLPKPAGKGSLQG
jgi:hypothetical protein